MPEIDAQALRLDTALVFDEIRTMATTDERQRLAREIHDGIAQEIASIGYVVDGMAASTSNPEMVSGLRTLRSELSRVVADLRLSIFDLRSDVSPTSGLGAALSDYVRQVGAKSDLTVHLTLKEAADAALPRRRERAVPDRPGGDHQRPQARRRPQPVGGLLDRARRWRA